MIWLEGFPVPVDLLPQRFIRLVTQVLPNPWGDFIEVATHLEIDPYGPDRENLLMQTAVVLEDKSPDLGAVRQKSSFDVVSSSTPIANEKGDIRDFSPSVGGHDYVVASWGNNSFYNFSLSEKVWMALGLSSRTVGGGHQRIIFDDLQAPEFGIAEGEASTEYEWTSKRSVVWNMRSDYLHRYLWMRGAFGVRVFYYSKLLPAHDALVALLDNQGYFEQTPDDNRYLLDLRMHDGGVLMQVWGAALALLPELSEERSAEGLIWPGYEEPMTLLRANALLGSRFVYLDDRFLDRYEQDAVFNCHVVKVGNQWHTSPSYRGQWAFTDCVRVGRNTIRVPMRKLYEAKPQKEILHAFDYVLSEEVAAAIDTQEEHIVSRTDRIVQNLLMLGDLLARLSGCIGWDIKAEAFVHLSREKIEANQWREYPEVRRLARAASLAMTQSAFLGRCKTLNELLARIPQRPLKRILSFCGCEAHDLKGLRSFSLIQILLNLLQEANGRGDDWEALDGIARECNWDRQNPMLTPLFQLNEMRNSEAHEDFGEILSALEGLDFDTALLNGGYGLALDHVFDACAVALDVLNSQLQGVLEG